MNSLTFCECVVKFIPNASGARPFEMENAFARP